MAKITKDMIIGEILKVDSGTVSILKQSGLHCLGCPSAQRETLEEACDVHDINSDELIIQLNSYLESK